MIEIKSEDLKKMEARMMGFQDDIKKVQVRALNRAGTAARTVAVKEAVKKYTLKSRDVKETMKMKRANWSRLNTSATVSNKPLPLERYKTNVKSVRPGKMIKAAAFKGQRIKPVGRRAFAWDMGGHRRIVRRKGASRLPIERLYGPSVGAIFGGEELTKRIVTRGEEMLAKRLDHEISVVLKRFIKE